MKKLFLVSLLLGIFVTLFSCKDTSTKSTKSFQMSDSKPLRRITYDTIYKYSMIEYKLTTADYVLSYSKRKGSDIWYSSLEFSVPSGKDYRLNIDGRDLFFEKYYDGSGSGLKDGFNAMASNGQECEDCVSDPKYTREYNRTSGIDFEYYIINEIKNSKIVTIQIVGETPKILNNIQKDSEEFMKAYSTSKSINIDWREIEKNRYKNNKTE